MLDTPLLVLAERECVEDRESARDRRAAREAGQREHPHTSVHRLQRLAFDRFVAAQILLREDAATRAHALDERSAELALVQHAWPVLRDGLERAREVLLHELVRGLRSDRRPE